MKKLKKKHLHPQLVNKGNVLMKKLLIIAIFMCFNTLSVFGADIIPSSSKSIKNYGIGILKIENGFDVYSEPNENSDIIGHFDLPVRKSAIIESTGAITPFIIEIPSQKDFYVTISEYPEGKWIQIYYNKKGDETGWIKFYDKKNFMTWKEFFYKYGRTNGIKVMRDTPSSEYKLYAKASDDAKVVDEFLYPEYAVCRMIQGNWMLITVADSGHESKTGWFKWRTNDGKLRLFPIMKEKI